MRAARIGAGLAGFLLGCLLLAVVASPLLRQRLERRVDRWRAGPCRERPGDRLASFPKVVFWAWERPEDLRFLQSASKPAAVAFLAKTIYVLAPGEDAGGADGSISVKHRMQPLLVDPGTPLMAVVRIESRGGRRPRQLRASGAESLAFTDSQRQAVAAEIVDAGKLQNVRAVQIDFDATLSERQSYIRLLGEVRQKLPAALPLSTTALASWCIGDRWLEQLPAGTIDEAVPMLFAMGRDAANVTAFLGSGEDFRAAACQNTLGLSTDEPLSLGILSGWPGQKAAMARGKRIYVFSARPWTRAMAETVLKEWSP
jgi:hypothetical protein